MWCTAFGPCYISDSHNTFTWQDINHSSFIFYTDGWWRWFWCSQNTLIKLIHLTQSAVLFLHEKWETDLAIYIILIEYSHKWVAGFVPKFQEGREHKKSRPRGMLDMWDFSSSICCWQFIISGQANSSLDFLLWVWSKRESLGWWRRGTTYLGIKG